MLLEAAAEAWNSACSAKTGTFFFTTNAPDNFWQSAPLNSSTTGPCSRKTPFSWNFEAAELSSLELSCAFTQQPLEELPCALQPGCIEASGETKTAASGLPLQTWLSWMCGTAESGWGPVGSPREHPKAVQHWSPKPTSAEQVNFWMW